MQLRNLILLVCTQLISATGSIVFVTLGGLIGSSLSSNPAWATLPLSMIVLASALTTMPAAMLMKKIGRRRGFALASCSAIVAVLTAAWALRNSSFELFLVAAMLFGKLKVCINGILCLQLEANVLIGTAEGAFIIGTSDRYLEDDCVCLAGRSDDIPYIVHIKSLQDAGLFTSKSFMNSTSFTTPSTGKAL